jgi:hypothetical protein
VRTLPKTEWIGFLTEARALRAAAPRVGTDARAQPRMPVPRGLEAYGSDYVAGDGFAAADGIDGFVGFRFQVNLV